MVDRLDDTARGLIEKAFAETADGDLVDYHLHALSLGTGLKSLCGRTGTTTAYVNPARFDWGDPLWKIKASVIMSAARIIDRPNADRQYVQRLINLVRAIPRAGTFHILALDAYHDVDGRPDWDKTDIHVPNEYVFELSDCLNKRLAGPRFVPVISVHPARQDAISALRAFASRGVRFVKWLPNVMNIDPAAPAYSPYFAEMARLKMTLLTHTGHESSLRSHDPRHQAFGNPLRFANALRTGVRVVMAHSGRDGSNADEKGQKRPNFELFRDMMKDPAYTGCLFGDISGLLIRDRRSLDYLATIMADETLRHRIVNGSDYPIPAVSFLNSTGELRRKGYIDGIEEAALDRIYGFNPLLFDYVVKRTIHHPRRPDLGLPASMFGSLDDLPRPETDHCRHYTGAK